MIQIRNVTRKYGDLVAVDNVSLDIDRGEIVGLLGHNGAGKTTLMKLLTGYLEPTQGTMQVGGADVVTERAQAQRQIGYLAESAPLYPEMLVQEYLVLMAELRGVPADQRRDAVGRAAGATGLGQRMLDPIRTLSKGFRQRVGIAQAIVHDPGVLVLDEPTNGLDPVQIHAIRHLVRRLAEHTTVLLSTHILQEVEALCDRVLIMIDGKMAADAPLDEMLASHAVRLSVQAGTKDVAKRLDGVEGVVGAKSMGADSALSGFELWSVDCTPGSAPAPKIARMAVEAGWTLGSIAPEQNTLDGVFRRLQQEHIAKSGTEAAA